VAAPGTRDRAAAPAPERAHAGASRSWEGADLSSHHTEDGAGGGDPHGKAPRAALSDDNTHQGAPRLARPP
jgi:hypothetical protein